MNRSQNTDSGATTASPPQDTQRPSVTRVLTAGARGADRVAHATGIDRVVNEAVEEAIVRAFRSPAVIRAIERAIEVDLTTGRSSEEIAQLVKRVLDSDVADRAWAEILASDEV